MNAFLKRWRRRLAVALLAAGLLAAPALNPRAFAQGPNDPAQPEDTSGGAGSGPVPGYLGVVLLSMLAMFIVCKSARR
jgi:hypothetical protein